MMILKTLIAGKSTLLNFFNRFPEFAVHKEPLEQWQVGRSRSLFYLVTTQSKPFSGLEWNQLPRPGLPGPGQMGSCLWVTGWFPWVQKIWAQDTSTMAENHKETKTMTHPITKTMTKTMTNVWVQVTLTMAEIHMADHDGAEGLLFHPVKVQNWKPSSQWVAHNWTMKLD